MSRRVAVIALSLMLALGARVAAADGAAKKPAAAKAPVDDVVKKLQARYDATTDFTATFKQTVEVKTLNQKLESTGQVYFKRPGRMRWEFAEPEKQTIVADGKMLWVHQPEHHQVLKAPFRAAFQSATPVSFLLGVGRLASDFNATLLTSSDDEVLRVKLLPKQDREIGVLILDLDSQTHDIQAAEVTDPLGNVTRLAFTDMKRDVGVKDSLFTFQAPPGTDVVEPPGNP